MNPWNWFLLTIWFHEKNPNHSKISFIHLQNRSCNKFLLHIFCVLLNFISLEKFFVMAIRWQSWRQLFYVNFVKNWKIFCLSDLTWNQICWLFRDQYRTVWKFHDFSTTQILREINFGDLWSAKSSVLIQLEALDFDFYAFLHILKAPNFTKFQSP